MFGANNPNDLGDKRNKSSSEISGMTYDDRVKHHSWEGKSFAVKMNYWLGEVDRRKRSCNYKSVYPPLS